MSKYKSAELLNELVQLGCHWVNPAHVIEVIWASPERTAVYTTSRSISDSFRVDIPIGEVVSILHGEMPGRGESNGVMSPDPGGET